MHGLLVGTLIEKNQEELLSILTERKDGEIIASILNWNRPKVTKVNLLEMALESTLMDISTGKRSTELKL